MTTEKRDRSLPVQLREWIAFAPLKVYEKATLDALAIFTAYSPRPKALEVWPSVAKIAEIAGCSSSQVKRSLSLLATKGYVKKLGTHELGGRSTS